MKNLFLFLLILTTVISNYSCSKEDPFGGKLAGFVTANESNFKILKDEAEGFNVNVIQTGSTATTEENGKFELMIEDPGYYNLEISKEGYSTKKVGISFLGGPETTWFNHDINLYKTPVYEIEINSMQYEPVSHQLSIRIEFINAPACIVIFNFKKNTREGIQNFNQQHIGKHTDITSSIIRQTFSFPLDENIFSHGPIYLQIYTANNAFDYYFKNQNASSLDFETTELTGVLEVSAGG